MKTKTLELASQPSTQTQPQQAMAVRDSNHLVSGSLEHAGSRNRRHAVAASYHHKHAPGPDW